MAVSLQNSVPPTGTFIKSELRFIDNTPFKLGTATTSYFLWACPGINSWSTGITARTEGRYRCLFAPFQGTFNFIKVNFISSNFIGASFVDINTPFTAFFGKDSDQDINRIRIKKSSLPNFIPFNQNTAESIKVALDSRFMDLGQRYTQLIESSFYRIEAVTLNPPVSTITALTNYYENSQTGDDADPVDPNNF